MNDSLDQAARLIEAERAQIAHEVHDSVLPLLFATSASLSSLIDHSGQSFHPEVLQRLEQARGWVDDAMQVSRRLLTEIYPPELKNTAWTLAAIDTLGRLIAGDSDRVCWQLDPTVNDVSDPVAFAAYRIVVEAVRNAVAHGGASDVVVSGSQDDQGLRIVIHDNGGGFDPSQIPESRFGVRSMIGRAELVGGRLTIDSTIGGPTSVTLVVPKAA